MKLLYLSISLVLTISNAYSAPSLQMHVFEEAIIQTERKPTAVTLSPSRKHRLQTHVFDNPANSSHVKATSITEHTSDEKPILEYQRAEFYTSIGYRKDDLSFSIAAINGTPNILSELTWKNIEVATLNMGSTLYFQPNWLLNIDVTYGHIFDGSNQDSDYRESNRNSEFSRSYSNSDKGITLDGSISAGYEWLAMGNKQQGISLIPKIGFSYHSQYFNDTDGEQVLSAPAPEFGIPEGNLIPLGAFAGLDSKYDASWFGPWLGLESQLTFNDRFQLGLNFEYHYAYYDATADWNLRSDFAHPESYTHEAEGYGLLGNMDAKYRLNNALSFTLSINYQDWKANRNGVDKTFFSNGTSLKTKLNEVNWRSFGANLGLIYEL